MTGQAEVRPAHLWIPPHVRSYADEAIDLGEMAGITLDAEQRHFVEAALAEDASGLWAAFEVGSVKARQNGKTLEFQVVALADLFLFDTRLIVWTAHQFPTTEEAFRDLRSIIEGTPEFSRRVKRIITGNGKESIELHGDRRIIFRARTKVGGRGLTGDRVVLDEAFALSASEIGSLMPTMSARPNPQLLYGSSAGLVGSAFLRSLRDRGRAGGDPSLAWVEFCAPPPAEACALGDECTHVQGTAGCAADDPEMWRRANPALGRRITVRYVTNERRTMPPGEFVRERLGWWDEPAAGVEGIPPAKWAACADRDAELSEPVVLGVDVGMGHTSGAIVACGGPLHLVEHRPGTGWIVPRLLELRSDHPGAVIACDPAGPVSALLIDLEAAGIDVGDDSDDVHRVEGRTAMQACEEFLLAVLEERLVHRDEGSLNVAVEGAGRRQVGDSWKWSRKDSAVDISPLVAATVALHVWQVLGLGEVDMGEQVF